jgi:hypothetical protein
MKAVIMLDKSERRNSNNTRRCSLGTKNLQSCEFLPNICGGNLLSLVSVFGDLQETLALAFEIQ